MKSWFSILPHYTGHELELKKSLETAQPTGKPPAHLNLSSATMPDRVDSSTTTASSTEPLRGRYCSTPSARSRGDDRPLPPQAANHHPYCTRFSGFFWIPKGNSAHVARETDFWVHGRPFPTSLSKCVSMVGDLSALRTRQAFVNLEGSSTGHSSVFQHCISSTSSS